MPLSSFFSFITKSKPQARIIGLGSYLPEKVLSNHDLEKMVDTSDEWIVTRTGMKERRLAGKQEFSSDMGIAAAKKALASAAISPDQIDLVLVATMSPDYLSPSTACLVQSATATHNAAAVDIQAACAGFLYGLSMAKAYIESNTYKNILLVATEKMSALVDYQDRNTCVLFGDGAAAAVISANGSGLIINSVSLGADGSEAGLLTVPGSGLRTPLTFESVQNKEHFLKMNGKELFKHAVRRMAQSAAQTLDKAGLKESQISWVVPHQANARIIDALVKNFDVSEKQVYKTLHKYGNTSASSVAIALDELTQEHPIKAGEHLLLVAFGAGLAWGATVLTKV